MTDPETLAVLVSSARALLSDPKRWARHHLALDAGRRAHADGVAPAAGGCGGAKAREAQSLTGWLAATERHPSSSPRPVTPPARPVGRHRHAVGGWRYAVTVAPIRPLLRGLSAACYARATMDRALSPR